MPREATGCLNLALGLRASRASAVSSAQQRDERAMAFDRELKGDLAHLLMQYDIQGCRGSQMFPDRTATLGRITGTSSSHHKTVLVFDQMMPEGLGPNMFWHDVINIPGDDILNEGLMLLWDASAVAPSVGETVWFRNIIDMGSFPEDYVFDCHSYWMKAKLSNIRPTTLHHLEMFSGGFGGWASAARMIHQCTGTPVQTIAIEHDPQIAKAYALSHHACYVKPDGLLPQHAFAEFEGPWVICANVQDECYLPAAANWGVDVISISSPCGPWSGASHAPGFTVPDGQSLIHAILQARWFRPAFLLFENVGGFFRHEHKQIFLRTLLMRGYKLRFEQVVNTQAQFGFVRARWLALASRVVDTTQPLIHLWPAQIGLPDHSRFVMQWNPATSGLALDKATVEIASDPRMLKYFNLRTEPPIFDHRKNTEFQVLPTFMALYGSQQTLSHDHLRKYGFFGHYKKEDELLWLGGARHWHPAEIGMIHGAVDSLFVPESLKLGWLINGNAITVMQAAILLVPAIASIMDVDFTLLQFKDEFESRRLTSSDLTITSCPAGVLLTHADVKPTQHLLDSIPELLALDDPDKLWLPIEGLGKFYPGAGILSGSYLKIIETQPDEETESKSIVPMTCEPTQPFSLVRELKIHPQGFKQTCLLDVDVPLGCIPWFWDNHLHIQESDNLDDHLMAMLPVESKPQTTHYVPGTIPILMESKLRFAAVDPTKPICAHSLVDSLPEDLYDLFGPVQSLHLPTESTILIDHLSVHGTIHRPITDVFAAFSKVVTSCSWNMQDDAFCFWFVGPNLEVEIVANFWYHVLPLTMLQNLGRFPCITTEATGTWLKFVPTQYAGVCPPKPFSIALSIAAARVLLDAMPFTDQGESFDIKIAWCSRVLWTGSILQSAHLLVVRQILKAAMIPCFQGDQVQLTCHGQIVPTDVEFYRVSFFQSGIVNELQLQRVGVVRFDGGGNKHQMRNMLQAALASTLLEQGVELSWISTATDQVLNLFTIPKLQSVTSMPPGPERVQAVFGLLKEAKIDIPEQPNSTSRKEHTGMPWQAKKKKPEFQINPIDFELVPNFFRNQDGTTVVQLTQFQPQTSGLCLMLPEAAIPFLKGEHLSTDELAIVALGPVPNGVDMPSKQVKFPCLNPNKHPLRIPLSAWRQGHSCPNWQSRTGQNREFHIACNDSLPTRLEPG